MEKPYKNPKKANNFSSFLFTFGKDLLINIMTKSNVKKAIAILKKFTKIICVSFNSLIKTPIVPNRKEVMNTLIIPFCFK